MPTLTEHTTDVLARILRRLPPSLWDTDPTSDTLQRDLAEATAAQCAIWLEQREVARTMTLLREAAGIDLDTLLADYGLKRYLQRPDGFARQIALQILWTPKGTLYAVDTLADLLFDQPHLTLITGRSHVHILLADSRPITTPYQYWGLVSQEGLWHALTIHANVPVISPVAPPGLNLAPGPHTLTWFTVLDELSAVWYVTIAADTLRPTQTTPAGYGTDVPFSLHDSTGTQWTLTVNSLTRALVATSGATSDPDEVVLSPSHVFQALQLRDSANTPWYLAVQAKTLTRSSALPTGAQDVTPAGGPYRWLRLKDLAGNLWYAFPDTVGGLVLSSNTPGGAGTAVGQTLGDTQGVRWRLGVSGATVAISDSPNVDYGGLATAVCLNDPSGQRWFWRVSQGHLQWSRVLWPDTIDQSPWGELGWLEMHNDLGQVVYVAPSLSGYPTATFGTPLGASWGWSEPVTLLDTLGQRWNITVTVRSPGLVSWQVRATDGTVQYFCIKGQVPGVTSAPPGGVDETPGGLPLDWLVAYEASGQPWYVTVEAGTLALSRSVPGGVGTFVPFEGYDALGVFWRLESNARTRAFVLRSVADAQVVRVAQLADATLPLLAPALFLRDAVDAISHVQAAGSLVTILVQ